MPNITTPQGTFPIVDKNGSMTEPFRLWVQSITRLDPIIGTGSPEGVVEAAQTRLYMDDAGSSGSILYIKKQAAISNDPTRGWIAV